MNDVDRKQLATAAEGFVRKQYKKISEANLATLLNKIRNDGEVAKEAKEKMEENTHWTSES